MPRCGTYDDWKLDPPPEFGEKSYPLSRAVCPVCECRVPIDQELAMLHVGCCVGCQMMGRVPPVPVVTTTHAACGGLGCRECKRTGRWPPVRE